MYVTIALYLRLSEADGDLGVDHKDESNSIENQRLLLYSYIQNRDDLAGEIKEYVDDGDVYKRQELLNQFRSGMA